MKKKYFFVGQCYQAVYGMYPDVSGSRMLPSAADIPQQVRQMVHETEKKLFVDFVQKISENNRPSLKRPDLYAIGLAKTVCFFQRN